MLTVMATVPLATKARAADGPGRDGAHDFDFDLGRWRTDIVRRVDPLGASEQTVSLTGTVTVRPLWDGKAQVEEIEADGPKGHWQAMTIFLYDPAAPVEHELHQQLGSAVHAADGRRVSRRAR